MTENTAKAVIFVITVATMAIIVAAMLRRRLFRQFPIFGWFAVYELISGCIIELCSLQMKEVYYFFVYWPDQLIEGIFTLYVIRELYRVVLEPYSCFRSTARTLFLNGMLVLLPFGILMELSTPQTYYGNVTTHLVSLERSLSFVQLSLVLLLFVFCHFFGLHWRPYSLGIALGVGLWGCAQLMAATYRVHLGFSASEAYVWAAPLSLEVGAAVWALSLVRREAELAVPVALLSPQLARWDAVLDDLLAR